MAALERRTVAQTGSVIDLRLRELINDFARIAHDPCALPAYASIYAGSVTINDSASLNATTNWQHVVGLNGFGSQNANPSLSRQAIQGWSVDPVVDPERLEAMRACFRYVLGGRDQLGPDSLSLLARPDQVPGAAGRHFGVLDQLERLPPGWLGRGSLHDVPFKACYKAHCGGTWVWVRPDGVQGLADFSLIMQNIARININSTTLFNPGPVPAGLTVPATDTRGFLNISVIDGPHGVLVSRVGPGDPASQLCVGDVILSVDGTPVHNVASFHSAVPIYNPARRSVTLQVARGGVLLARTMTILPPPQVTVSVAVDPFGNLAPDTPYYRIRIDSLGSDPFLRSQLATVQTH